MRELLSDLVDLKVWNFTTDRFGLMLESVFRDMASILSMGRAVSSTIGRHRVLQPYRSALLSDGGSLQEGRKNIEWFFQRTCRRWCPPPRQRSSKSPGESG